ncbi:cyclic-di-AMP receptor [Alkalihalobacillus pseudalcaliphilus]|uniref:cyclic-di-AMP receptor n=1 Tax=Alkalihalobacillus pseudalcaliphilus TaxID=79884 RepID=UPI00064DABA8|nr:cyclic-di-AMP receptor [Alkalihalobacillus pseudalcaliphilus]KMK74925.1 protein from nitrogen regulatory protein P-II [Alkalihalobacillus pseudalcaliphilus]
MKLFICIVEHMYTDEVEKSLREKGYRMTELASSGGFLRKGNTTFLIGLEEEHHLELKTALQQACLKVEERKQRKKQNGAHRYTSFLIDVKDVALFLENKGFKKR